MLSYSQALTNFDNFTGLYPFFTQALTAGSLDLTNAATAAVDLTLDSVIAPTTALGGEAIAVQWQVTNQSVQAADGSWKDKVYLSSTPEITAASRLLGSAIHTGGLAAGGSYVGNLTVDLPAVLPGSYYVIVQVDGLYQIADPERTNNTRSTGAIEVDLPDLTGAQFQGPSRPPIRTAITG